MATSQKKEEKRFAMTDPATSSAGLFRVIPKGAERLQAIEIIRDAFKLNGAVAKASALAVKTSTYAMLAKPSMTDGGTD